MEDIALLILFFSAITGGMLWMAYCARHPKCKNCGNRFSPTSEHNDLCPECVNRYMIEYEQQREQKKLQKEKENAARLAELKEQEKNAKVVPMEYMGRMMAYHYSGVKLYIVPGQEPDFPKLDPGDDLDFIKEPENEYDHNAVYAKTNITSRSGEVKVGYIYRGKLQDMINDYIRMGLPILSHIEAIDDDEGVVKIFIAFYRDIVRDEDIDDDDDDLDLDDDID